MIIDKEYDDSLFLMTCGNKNIGIEIKLFFNEIPDEFLLQINNALKLYKENYNDIVSKWDLYKDRLEGKCLENNGTLYRFVINVFGTLELSESLVFDDEMYNLRYISLNPFNSNVYDCLNFGDRILLGKVSNGYSYIDGDFVVPDSISTSAYLERGTFNYDLITTNGVLTGGKNKRNFISIKKIPENYNLSKLTKNDKFKKLTRKKRSK